MLRRDWRILLVEDDPDDHVLIGAIVREMGCSLDWADRYDAALERIGQQSYDACLIDYRLGSRDGLEFIREGVARGCQAPMILLTGQGDLAVDMKAMEAGAVDYLAKGRIALALLERSIRYAIDRKQAEAVLANRARELAYFNAAVKEFADVATDDLKEPLQTITGVLQFLKRRFRGELDQDAEALLARGLEAIERMKERVSELTTLSQAVAEGADPRRSGG